MIARFLIGRFMSNMLLAPAQWAQNEFGFAQLGDQRRNQRLVKIATHLAARPGGTLPQAFPDWAELKAAYRFFPFVIRGYQNRRLAQEAGSLRQALAQAPVLGQSTVEVRARGGQAARTAKVQLRSVRVDLDGPWRPQGWQAPLLDVGVVAVVEVEVPAGVKEPLPWILLTSLPCRTWAEAQRVVGYYAARWCIEEYHKALKSGTGVEQSQLEGADRLESLIAVLAVVAVRLLNTKRLARSRPESGEAAESFGPQMLSLLEKKLGRPDGGWTNRNLIRTVAHLGGFIGRKQDGEPGWQTIWRGWQRLMWLCEGANLIEG
jgi:Transposase DNA-binding/Transposase Tn5 dimerisation domain